MARLCLVVGTLGGAVGAVVPVGCKVGIVAVVGARVAWTAIALDGAEVGDRMVGATAARDDVGSCAARPWTARAVGGAWGGVGMARGAVVARASTARRARAATAATATAAGNSKPPRRRREPGGCRRRAPTARLLCAGRRGVTDTPPIVAANTGAQYPRLRQCQGASRSHYLEACPRIALLLHHAYGEMMLRSSGLDWNRVSTSGPSARTVTTSQWRRPP